MHLLSVAQIHFVFKSQLAGLESAQVFNPRTSQSLMKRRRSDTVTLLRRRRLKRRRLKRRRLKRRRLRRRKLIERWFPAEQNGPIQRNTKFYGNLTRGKKQKLRLNCSLNILDFTHF